VFLAAGPTRAAVRERGIPVAVVETGRARHVWRAPGAVRTLRALIERHRADVVFSHLAKAHLYAAPAAGDVPTLWWQHALPGQQQLQHRVAERMGARAIVCSSDFTAELQRARTPGTPVHRIYPGTPQAPQAAPGDGTHVGTVARLQRYKRIERLLDAIPLVLAAVPEARFAVIGGGEDPAYEAELERRGAAVTFTGHVNDPGDRIAGLDVLVHTAELEPFGLAVAEALARGVPVVAPRTGGPAEIVRDGLDGLLVDTEDARELAAAIVRLLREPGLRRRMGEAGRAHVTERFSEQRMAQEAWQLAEHVAAAPPARRPRR
jgi:glycosyltransferase involved in cell wall biosynthesis